MGGLSCWTKWTSGTASTEDQSHAPESQANRALSESMAPLGSVNFPGKEPVALAWPSDTPTMVLPFPSFKGCFHRTHRRVGLAPLRLNTPGKEKKKRQNGENQQEGPDVHQLD